MSPSRPVYRLAALTVILTLALLLRIAAVYLIEPNDIGSYTESGVTARNFADGNGYIFDFYHLRRANPLQATMPPVFTALLALCLRFAADPAHALGLTQAVLSMLTILVIYLTAAKLSNPAVALLTAAGLAVYPVFVIMPAYPISLTVNTLLLSLVVYLCLLLAEKQTVPLAVLTGLCLGFAILAKPQQLAFVPLLLFWFWLNVRNNRPRLRRLLVIAVILGALPLLPWTIRNYSIFGRFVLISTNGGFTFWNGNNPFTTGSGFDVDSARFDAYLGVPHDPQKPPIIGNMIPYPMPKEIAAQVANLDEIALDRALYAASFDFIRNDPGRWLELTALKFTGFWWFRSNIGLQYEASWTRYYQIIYAALAALALLGLLLSLQDWRRYSLLYLIIACTGAICVVFQVQTRYRWEVEPYYILFAAIALYQSAVQMRPRR